MTREIDISRRLPDRLAKYTLEGITPDLSFDPVRAYHQKLHEYVKAGVGLCLSGPNGSGKSGAQAAIFSFLRLAKPNWGSREKMWCRARDVASTYGYFMNDQEFDQPIDDLYEKAKYLIIDELGRETDIKNFDSRMFSLLGVRRDNNLVTGFTTNLSLGEGTGSIHDKYGVGFYSTLHETCVLVSVGGKDRRR